MSRQFPLYGLTISNDGRQRVAMSTRAEGGHQSRWQPTRQTRNFHFIAIYAASATALAYGGDANDALRRIGFISGPTGFATTGLHCGSEIAGVSNVTIDRPTPREIPLA